LPQGSQAAGLFADVLALLEGFQGLTADVNTQYEEDMQKVKQIELCAGRLFSTKVQFHGTSAAKPAGDPTKAPPQKRHKTEGTKCPSLEQLSTQLGCVQHETKLVQEEYARKCKDGTPTCVTQVDEGTILKRWARIHQLNTALHTALPAFNSFIKEDVCGNAQSDDPAGYPMGMQFTDALKRYQEIQQLLSACTSAQQGYEDFSGAQVSTPEGFAGNHIYALTNTVQVLEEASARRKEETSTKDPKI